MLFPMTSPQAKSPSLQGSYGFIAVICLETVLTSQFEVKNFDGLTAKAKSEGEFEMIHETHETMILTKKLAHLYLLI